MGQPLRIVTEFRGRQLTGSAGEQLRIEACRNMNWRMESRIARLPDVPERRSVARAMLSVEERLVKAFWTIARQPLGAAQPMDVKRCGIEYIHDRADTHARYKDAAGGKWEAEAPRPSLPSAKEIDAADQALDWLLLIGDETMRKLLVVGATFKRGDAGRRINWLLVRAKMPELSGLSLRTLKWRYQEALRIIVNELTLARAA